MFLDLIKKKLLATFKKPEETIKPLRVKKDLTIRKIIKALAHKNVKKQLVKELELGFEFYSEAYNMTNKKRIAAFWSQMAHETGGFRWLEELGGKKYFEKYDGRRALGNTQPGDGYKYKGRGLIHITGRYNYRRFGKIIGLDLIKDPAKAAEPSIAILIALKYWKDRKLNKLADIEDIRNITRLINGGYNGLKERSTLYKKAIEV